MSKKNKLLVLIVAAGTITLVGLAFLAFQSSQVRAAAGVPDTQDARDIMAVMDHAYTLIGTASQNFDVSEFPKVFVDTADYKLTQQQQAAVTGILGSNAKMASPGYLTAMQTQFISRGQGAKLLKAAVAKAKAAGREITADELQTLIQQNHGQVPAPVSPVLDKTVLTYESMEITENRAVVRYDDGAALQEAILVKINGQWFIAGITPIFVHF